MHNAENLRKTSLPGNLMNPFGSSSRASMPNLNKSTLKDPTNFDKDLLASPSKNTASPANLFSIVTKAKAMATPNSNSRPATSAFVQHKRMKSKKSRQLNFELIKKSTYKLNGLLSDKKAKKMEDVKHHIVNFDKIEMDREQMRAMIARETEMLKPKVPSAIVDEELSKKHTYTEAAVLDRIHENCRREVEFKVGENCNQNSKNLQLVASLNRYLIEVCQLISVSSMLQEAKLLTDDKYRVSFGEYHSNQNFDKKRREVTQKLAETKVYNYKIMQYAEQTDSPFDQNDNTLNNTDSARGSIGPDVYQDKVPSPGPEYRLDNTIIEEESEIKIEDTHPKDSSAKRQPHSSKKMPYSIPVVKMKDKPAQALARSKSTKDGKQNANSEQDLPSHSHQTASHSKIPSLQNEHPEYGLRKGSAQSLSKSQSMAVKNFANHQAQKPTAMSKQQKTLLHVASNGGISSGKTNNISDSVLRRPSTSIQPVKVPLDKTPHSSQDFQEQRSRKDLTLRKQMTFGMNEETDEFLQQLKSAPQRIKQRRSFG